MRLITRLCGLAATTPDGGAVDAGSTDASSVDAGATDAGSSDAGSTDAGAIDASTSPPPPALGAQIDRAGRPLVNTMLNRAFAMTTARDNARDAWNASGDPSTWEASFASALASDLAVFDALDTVCGNQLLSCNDAQAGCYSTFARLSAYDWLLVKGDATGGCSNLFSVEVSALGLIANDQCGGRTPSVYRRRLPAHERNPSNPSLQPSDAGRELSARAPRRARTHAARARVAGARGAPHPAAVAVGVARRSGFR